MGGIRIEKAEGNRQLALKKWSLVSRDEDIDN